MLEASVIVPTRNRAAIVAECLRRLQMQDIGHDRFEVIVIDDGSSDDTAKQLHDIAERMPNLLWRSTARPVSTATAFISHVRNVALRLAKGRVVISIDDDCLVGPDFVRIHLDHHRARSMRLVTGPIIDVRAFPPTSPPRAKKRAGWHNNPIPGGNFSVQKDVLLRAGGFDENFIHYGWEDLELYERLRTEGVRRKFDAALPVYHFKPTTFDTDFPTRIRREVHRGAMGAYFYQRHPHFLIGVQTKQHPALRLLARLLNPVFGLERQTRAALKSGVEPSSGLMRALVREYAEIEGAQLLEEIVR